MRLIQTHRQHFIHADNNAPATKQFIGIIVMTVIPFQMVKNGVISQCRLIHFTRSKKFRAIAGGGRYDRLLSDLSDGGVNLPAIGFGVGDVVLTNLIEQTPVALAVMQKAISESPACETYVVIAEESRRLDAIGLVQQLRNAGVKVDFPLAATKVGKQFQAAELAGARVAVVIGNEWPVIKVKHLASRTEEALAPEALTDRVKKWILES